MYLEHVLTFTGSSESTDQTGNMPWIELAAQSRHAKADAWPEVSAIPQPARLHDRCAAAGGAATSDSGLLRCRRGEAPRSTSAATAATPRR